MPKRDNGKAVEGSERCSELSLIDSVCIIVGVVVGIGIFEAPPVIAASLPNANWVIGFWLLGALISLCGVFTYAELASAYPEAGGDYAYLKRAFGRWCGFLFAWGQITTIRPGSIAAMSFPFGHYAARLYNPWIGGEYETSCSLLYSLGSVVFLTAVNIAGVSIGALTQNILTLLKTVGILIVVVTACALAAPAAAALSPSSGERPHEFGLALILVLFCYGGWNEIVYAASEVKDPSRNMLRSMTLGLLVVGLVYVVTNGAYLTVLGYEGLASSKAVAADTIGAALPIWGVWLISGLICLSALGAMQGMIFTGSRVNYALGEDYGLFRLFAAKSVALNTPYIALLFQGAVSAAIVAFAGSFAEVLVYTTAVVWTFYLLSGLSVFVLRAKDPDRARPYRTFGYPVTPIIFCISCAYLVYRAYIYNPEGTLFAIVLLLLGLPFYGLEKMRSKG